MFPLRVGFVCTVRLAASYMTVLQQQIGLRFRWSTVSAVIMCMA